VGCHLDPKIKGTHSFVRKQKKQVIEYPPTCQVLQTFPKKRLDGIAFLFLS
jgi:hypothetical protein